MIRRPATIVLGSLAALLLAVLLVLAWFLLTASGTRTLWELAQSAVPQLRAEHLEGRLIGPLSLRGVYYETEFLRLEVAAVELDWSPALLWQRTLEIKSLQLRDVSYTQLQSSPEDPAEEPFTLPDSLNLPLGIALENMELHGLEYRPSPEAEPFVVTSAAVAASLENDELKVSQLAAEGPLFTLHGDISATTRDDYPTAAKLVWEVRLPGYAPLGGETTVTGGLPVLQLQQRLRAPYNVELAAELRDVLGALVVEARLDIRDTDLQAVSATLPAMRINGSAQARGNPSALDYRLDLAVAAAEFGQLNLVSRGGLKDQRVTLEKLLLTVADTPTRIEADGQVELAGAAPEIQLRGSWQELRWPLAAPRIESRVGRASVAGTLRDYNIELDAALTVPEQGNGQLHLAGSGNDRSLQLTTVHLDLLEGAVDGSADVAWQPDLKGRISLRGDKLNPVLLAPEWPGQIALDLQASGEQHDGKLAAEISTLTLAGTLRGQPLDVQIQGRVREQLFLLDTFDLNSGPSQVSAQGSLGDTMALDWRIDSPDLGTLVPRTSGALKGEGSIGGSLPWPIVRARLTAADLQYGEYGVASLELDADVDPERETASELHLSVRDATLVGVTVSDAELIGSGTRAGHQFSLRSDTSEGSVAIDLAGKYQPQQWAIELTSGRLQYGDLAPWTLAQSQAGKVTADEQALERGCWTSGQARFCMQGRRDKQGIGAALDLEQLPFAYFGALMPAGIAVLGNLDGNAEIKMPVAGEPSVKLQVATTASELRATEAVAGADELLLALAPGAISFDYGDDGLAAKLELPFVGQGGIFARATVAAGAASVIDRPLDGQIELALDDLGFLGILSPEIERAGGSVRGKFQLSGTPAKPLPTGSLEMDGGQLRLAAPGLELGDITLQAQASDAAVVVFTGRARSGEGSLELAGTAQLGGAQPQVEVSVTGDQFQVFNTAEARVFVSPDLDIAVAEHGIDVNGVVRVPRAEITPKQLPVSAVSVSPDQLIVVQDAAADGDAGQGPPLRAQVSIILGDAVSVDGFGFKGRVTGELAVEQLPGKPTLGTGELKIVDGEYRAYGQGLVIEKGLILFPGGPIDQPGINLRAVRRPAADITVGIRARGSMQQPDFTLYSEPGMSQSEQLSWLVLGRPLNNTSDEESNMVTQAAMALGLKGGNFLTDKLGGNLGVDDIGFETGSGEAGGASDVNQAEFVIGKYLSPDLYVKYGIGLFNSISTVMLEYSINDNWKLATESSTEASGGDVIYTIER